MSMSSFDDWKRCPYCLGTGRVRRKKCKRCEGSGYLKITPKGKK